MVGDHEDRLRRVEETLDDLLASGSKVHPARLRFIFRGAWKTDDATVVCGVRIHNYGKGAAHDVRCWVETKEGEAATTVGGGNGITIDRRKDLDLEVTELPQFAEVSGPGYGRVAWRDVTGEHEERRRIW